MSRTEIGFHASHEQFTPERLLEAVQSAEDAGFEAVLASDHFHPWSERQGESGHVWSWLGAAMQATTLPMGTVNAPGYRYHPAVIAQATATLASMYPGRFWVAIGSGQLLNEGITGTKWPPKDDRNERLIECATIIRQLWDGNTVTQDGQVTVESATLYTRPDESPLLVGAALSTETARWLGTWADGMITLGTPDHDADRKRVEAFRDVAPEKPIFLKSQLSFASNHDSALDGAYDQWRTNCIPGPVTQQLRTPEDYDKLGEEVDKAAIPEHVRVSADPAEHREWIEQDLSLDVDRIFLHNVNTNQESFIEAFGDKILPAVSSNK